MADETITSDKPLSSLKASEQSLDTRSPATEPVVDAEPEVTPATVRLRAFEDEQLGPNVVRINGNIERGYGSPFKDLSEPKHRKYAALEKLVISEQKLADAHTALIQADADHDAAEDEVAAADEAIAGESDNGGA